jgi:V/A-type H+-transporting ATPase subunit F
MYRFIVVTDPDTAAGFRLSGVEVMEAADFQEARKIIPPLLLRDDTGIIAVNEEYIQFLDEKLIARIERTYRPIILPIPVHFRGGTGPGYLERLLRRAIGYNVVLRH